MSELDKAIERAKERDRLDINRKEIPIGSIVYYVKKYGHKWSVNWGTLEEHYIYESVIQLYETYNWITVNGIPIKDLETPTRWQKLPKGWNYDTKLFEIGHDEKYEKFNEIYKNLKISNKEDIQKAIDMGLFIKAQDKDHSKPTAEIDKRYGWRIVKEYDDYITYTTVKYNEVYVNYEDAKRVVDEHEAELKRQSELSDLEWSIEQIDKTLDLWTALYHVTDLEKQKTRDRIMSFHNLEDVEVRLRGGNIQWKYWKNCRWNNIEL